MKTIAYTALHYGSDYLAYAIRSVIDYIDEYVVLYSAQGSHGHRSPIPCPDTRDQLYAIAQAAAGDKLRWFEGEWPYEGAQRETIHRVCPDADVILVLDYDEVWEQGLPELAIQTALNSNVGRWRIPFRHYWRSFSKCILHDPAYPERIIVPSKSGIETLDAHGLAVNHFGYAIRTELLKYKWCGIHGHQNELRRDCDWINDVFVANRQYDTHPVGSEYWNPEDVDPTLYLPSWMDQHPYWGKAVIE